MKRIILLYFSFLAFSGIAFAQRGETVKYRLSDFKITSPGNDITAGGSLWRDLIKDPAKLLEVNNNTWIFSKDNLPASFRTEIEGAQLKLCTVSSENVVVGYTLYDYAKTDNGFIIKRSDPAGTEEYHFSN